MAIAEGQWREVALSDEEYASILELLGREPSEVELGMFGAMWSEHCGYKHSRPLLKGLPTEAPWVVQGPGENAGAVDLGNGYAAVFKVESHNHPSAVEPYEGAATGIGGIVRDIFTMGARPVALLGGLRVGPLDVPRNSYLYSHIVRGLGGYANCLGVASVGGDLFFDESYNGNPLVNAMGVGIVPVDGIVRAAASGIGNVVMIVGATTGRDGLGGATFSSVDDPETSHSGVIQAGNPFLEKQLMEACLELLQQGVVVAMQDLGAAGLTSSTVECASRGNVGVDIDVALVPRREDGMNAYEIMLSESQERMVLVASPENVGSITDVLNKWDLNASVIGQVTDTGRVVVRDGDIVECDVPVRHFVDDCPTYAINPNRPVYLDEVASFDLDSVPDITENDIVDTLLKLLTSPNVGSRRSLYDQLDSTVQTNTVYGPGQADAAVVRQKHTNGGMAISLDCNSRYVYLDPELGAQHAVAEAARNVACTGATPLGLTNCLNFGSPERNPADYQLVHAVKGMGEASSALNVPIVSGNVSLRNETNQIPVYPTPMIGCVGVLEDLDTRMGMAWNDGESLFLVGGAEPTIGGTEYLAFFHETTAGTPPSLDLDAELRLIQFLQKIGTARIGASVHDLSVGGLALGIIEMALASGSGVDLEHVPMADRVDTTWFGESAGRVLVAVSKDSANQLVRIAEEWDLPVTEIGTTGGDSIVFPNGSSVNLESALAASEKALAVGVEAEMA